MGGSEGGDPRRFFAFSRVLPSSGYQAVVTKQWLPSSGYQAVVRYRVTF